MQMLTFSHFHYFPYMFPYILFPVYNDPQSEGRIQFAVTIAFAMEFSIAFDRVVPSPPCRLHHTSTRSNNVRQSRWPLPRTITVSLSLGSHRQVRSTAAAQRHPGTLNADASRGMRLQAGVQTYVPVGRRAIHFYVDIAMSHLLCDASSSNQGRAESGAIAGDIGPWRNVLFAWRMYLRAGDFLCYAFVCSWGLIDVRGHNGDGWDQADQIRSNISTRGKMRFLDLLVEWKQSSGAAIPWPFQRSFVAVAYVTPANWFRTLWALSGRSQVGISLKLFCQFSVSLSHHFLSRLKSSMPHVAFRPEIPPARISCKALFT